MKKLFADIKKYSIIYIIVALAVGILLLIYPREMLKVTIYVIGGSFIIAGLVSLINYFVKHTSPLFMSLAIVAIIVGAVVLIAAEPLAKVSVLFLCIMLLIGGIIDLTNSFFAAAIKNMSWIATVLMAIASIALGVYGIRNNQNATDMVIRLVGVGFIIFAVTDIIAYFQIRAVVKDTQRKIIQTQQDEQQSRDSVEVEYTEVQKEAPDSQNDSGNTDNTNK